MTESYISSAAWNDLLSSDWLHLLSLCIDVLVSSHGGVEIALFLHGDSISFHQGVTVRCCSWLVFPWRVEALLPLYALFIGRFHLSSFVCMGSHELACISTFFYLDHFLVFLFDLAC